MKMPLGFRLGWTAAGTLAVALLGASLQAQVPTLYTTTHAAMGTDFTLAVYSPDAASAAAISEQVFDEVDRVEQLLSNYRDTSELQRINRSASTGPVTTDAEMMDFLQQSLRWSRASDGAFDITVGRLMKAWGFYRHAGRVPPSDELVRLRAATGWQKVELDPQQHTVRFLAAGVELDPGGIGKGFAVDAVVRILRDAGVTSAMISAGSSTIYALGAPPGQRGWRVTVPGPLPLTATLSTVILRDASLSSADCSQKNFRERGHLYCHIMDLATMRPVEGRIQVTVIDPSATASDALSNVVFVQSPEASRRTLQTSAPEAKALIVSGYPSHAICTRINWPEHLSTAHCKTRPTPSSSR